MKQLFKWLIPLAAVLTMASGCWFTTIYQNSSVGDTLSVNYPTGFTYDYLWMGFNQDMANAVHDNDPWANGAEVQVCFPDHPLGDYYRPYFSAGNPPGWNNTKFAGCTAWVQIMDSNFQANGWHPMVGIFPGEHFTARIRINYSNPNDTWNHQTYQTGLAGRVANYNNTQVWYDFCQEKQDGIC